MPEREGRAPVPTAQGISMSQGWYIKWGPSVTGKAYPYELVIGFALDNNGTNVEPLVVNEAGSIVTADSISTDYTISHPFHYTYEGQGPV